MSRRRMVSSGRRDTQVIKHWKAATPATAGAAALLAVAGVTGLAIGGVLWRRSRPLVESSAAPVPPQRPLRPLPTWIIPVAALVVAGITWAAVWGLQSTVPAGVGTPLQRAQLWVGTIRTGLSVGAGVGAAAALLLALCRQQATEYDASER